uniref:Uncharacterized protein n=1 Tax=Meloidogyne enterolobii TaxID=390850 RepID=A0A6V7W572_MELEN|nr:unnamed protein product [Meloidogyne enterolobii]
MNGDEFLCVNNTTKISREELMAYVREELICTIGSADSPVTIPVLITTFREDTCNDIGVLAENLDIHQFLLCWVQTTFVTL